MEAKEKAIVQDGPENEKSIPELEELDNLLEKYQHRATSSASMPEGHYLSTSVPIQEFYGTSVSASESQYLGFSVPSLENQVSASEGQYLGTPIAAPEWGELGNNQLPLGEAATFEMDKEEVQVVTHLFQTEFFIS